MTAIKAPMVTKGGMRDTVTGAIVVAVGVVFLALVYTRGGGEEAGDGYLLTAKFNKADGISVGSQVRLSGVTVGKVVGQTLDPDFRAVTTLRIAGNVQLTADTAAAIHTDGLLGGKYLELKPGGDDAVLKPGSRIEYTQDAVVVEELLEMIIQQGRSKRGFDADRPANGPAH